MEIQLVVASPTILVSRINSVLENNSEKHNLSAIGTCLFLINHAFLVWIYNSLSGTNQSVREQDGTAYGGHVEPNPE